MALKIRRVLGFWTRVFLKLKFEILLSISIILISFCWDLFLEASFKTIKLLQFNPQLKKPQFKPQNLCIFSKLIYLFFMILFHAKFKQERRKKIVLFLKNNYNYFLCIYLYFFKMWNVTKRTQMKEEKFTIFFAGALFLNNRKQQKNWEKRN